MDMPNSKDVAQPNRVLLVSVYNLSSEPITNNQLFEKFSPFGEVEKILIFDKAKLCKSFVQMKHTADAVMAKEQLNESYFRREGSKMYIYYAKIKELNFTGKNKLGKGILFILFHTQLRIHTQLRNFSPFFFLEHHANRTLSPKKNCRKNRDYFLISFPSAFAVF